MGLSFAGIAQQPGMNPIKPLGVRNAGTGKIKDIDDEVFKEYMYTAGMTDPDLLIRTGGEMRVSNFLLWEVSYAELWFTPVYWPEFKKKHLEEALSDYAKRERRFGGLIE